MQSAADAMEYQIFFPTDCEFMCLRSCLENASADDVFFFHLIFYYFIRFFVAKN